MAKNRKEINLALQGGGAHGAFTWGICDRLLECDDLHINAITATSAGAMIGTALAYGYHLNDSQGARDLLDEFWEGVAKLGNPLALPQMPPIPYLDEFKAFWSKQASTALTNTLSPYQFNPGDWNPFRDFVGELIDFDRLRACTKMKLFVSATNVRSGKVKVFPREEISLDACMASACLPQLYRAVEIDGEAYWDGGYMGNPSLWPLFYETDVRDMLVVHINPIVREEVPKTVAAIEERMNEITFNSSLLKEMRAVAFVQRLVREDMIKDEYKDKFSDIRYHAIRSEEYLTNYAMDTKYKTDIGFLRELKAIGRNAAETWIDASLSKIGRQETTDLREEFLGAATRT